ncbi:hypothetical protein MBH78_01245 [Oceanimonas sp. NS1]|nr:hypothetical protein [Oceanimonas sp. NS1]
MDLALAGDGRYGADLVRSLDFVPGEQAPRLSELQVVEQSDQRVVIELRREWQGRTLTSRYEVNRDTAGIRLSTTLPSAESVFAGYRLERNEASPPAPTTMICPTWCRPTDRRQPAERAGHSLRE